jgi:hypothetical protein
MMTLPQPLMLANAARAAMHASKLSWLAGQARDEENARSLNCAAEAVHIATRMAQLDVLELSVDAMPQSAAGPVVPVRATPTLWANRILMALPT